MDKKSTYLWNLNESSTYEFIVRAQNSYNESSTTDSSPQKFDTKGMFKKRLTNMKTLVYLLHCTQIFIAAKPTFEDGEFTVNYQSNTATLFWPKPSGIFTRQTIQKQKVQSRRKRTSNDCQGQCVEEEVPLNQTSHITDIEAGQKYEFRLVLYDGDVVVQSMGGPRVIKFNPGTVKKIY